MLEFSISQRAKLHYSGIAIGVKLASVSVRIGLCIYESAL